MRIRTTEKQLKEVEVTKESYIECDKCMSKIRTGAYDAFNCEVIVTTGEAYPESIDTLERSVDLCQNCAEDMIKLLSENGYRINEVENGKESK